MSDLAPAATPALSAQSVFVRYVLFAILAGACNLLVQEAVVRALPQWPLMLAILAGTGVGFFVKYLLDKRWVFLNRYEGHGAELRKITLYGFFSVGTTLIFWAVELGAWYLWRTSEAKYLGAILGLSLGNWVKYQLDRHYVFRKAP